MLLSVFHDWTEGWHLQVMKTSASKIFRFLWIIIIYEWCWEIQIIFEILWLVINYLQYVACSPPPTGFFLEIYFWICNSFFHVILIDSSFWTCSYSLTLIYLSWRSSFSYFWICFLKCSLILTPLFFLSQTCPHLELRKTFGLFLLSPHWDPVSCSCFSLVTLMMPVRTTMKWDPWLG